MPYEYFVVSHVYTDHTEVDLFTRKEMEEKSWVVSSANMPNPLLHLDCGEFDMYINGFPSLKKARRFMKAEEART